MKNTYPMRKKRIEAVVGFKPTHKSFADFRVNRFTTQPPKKIVYMKKNCQRTTIQRYYTCQVYANF